MKDVDSRSLLTVNTLLPFSNPWFIKHQTIDTKQSPIGPSHQLNKRKKLTVLFTVMNPDKGWSGLQLVTVVMTSTITRFCRRYYKLTSMQTHSFSYSS